MHYTKLRIFVYHVEGAPGAAAPASPVPRARSRNYREHGTCRDRSRRDGIERAAAELPQPGPARGSACSTIHIHFRFLLSSVIGNA